MTPVIMRIRIIPAITAIHIIFLLKLELVIYNPPAMISIENTAAAAAPIMSMCFLSFIYIEFLFNAICLLNKSIDTAIILYPPEKSIFLLL